MHTMDVSSSVAQKIIIMYLVDEEVKPSNIYERISSQFLEECLFQTQVGAKFSKTMKEKRDLMNQYSRFLSEKTKTLKTMWLGISFINLL